MSNISVRVVLPAVSDDTISGALRDLTKAISESGKAEASWGVLGGTWGYGCPYENDTFVMRPYCWDDCDCGAAESDEDIPHKDTCCMQLPNFMHKPSGAQIRWYKYIGRSMEIGKCDVGWFRALNECFDSIRKPA